MNKKAQNRHTLVEAEPRPYRPTRRDSFLHGAIGATILAILVAVGLLVTQLPTRSEVIARKAPHHHSALPLRLLDPSGRVVKSQAAQPLNTTSQSAPPIQESDPPLNRALRQSVPPATVQRFSPSFKRRLRHKESPVTRTWCARETTELPSSMETQWACRDSWRSFNGTARRGPFSHTEPPFRVPTTACQRTS